MKRCAVKSITGRGGSLAAGELTMGLFKLKSRRQEMGDVTLKRGAINGGLLFDGVQYGSEEARSRGSGGGVHGSGGAL